jgi:hypothetical protein
MMISDADSDKATVHVSNSSKYIIGNRYSEYIEFKFPEVNSGAVVLLTFKRNSVARENVGTNQFDITINKAYNYRLNVRRESHVETTIVSGSELIQYFKDNFNKP